MEGTENSRLRSPVLMGPWREAASCSREPWEVVAAGRLSLVGAAG